METIDFLVFTNDLSIGKQNNLLRVEFHKNACKLIETEINVAGGIAGKKVIIHYTHVPLGMGHGEEVADEIIKVIRSNPNIICMNGASNKAANEILLQELNLDQMLYFSGTNVGGFHPNKFQVTRRSDETNAKLISHITKALNNNSNIFYLHRGIRTANHESKFTPTDRENLISKNFSGIQEITEIKNKVAETLCLLDDNDIVIIDLDLKALKEVINYLNEKEKQSVVWSLFGSVDNRFSKIAFPLRQASPDFGFRDLDFQQLINTAAGDFTEEEKITLSSSYPNLEFPLLVAYASKEAGLTFSNKEQFLTDTSRAINAIDGKNDIFTGKGGSYAFKDNVNILRSSYLYQFPTSLQRHGTYSKLFYPEQISNEIDGYSIYKVNYVNIDVLRATNINIGDGTWGCEFYLDIVSPHDNPLEIINFNNLSSINPKFEAKPISKEHVDEEEENSCRYYVVANFDFSPLADNYPFDWQHIYISFSIADQNRYGIIQPIPEALLDKDFHVDGWNLNEATTGVLRKKELTHKGTNYLRRIKVREEARVGWILARANSVTLMKIGIPLSFLLFLNYYTLFMNFKNIGDSVGILTTAFLAGIALYFSTERPQPLRMTTVDLIFLWYYMLTGIIIVVTSISSLLGAKIFILAVIGLKFIVPLGIIAICIFILRRIKSNRLKPRIN